MANLGPILSKVLDQYGLSSLKGWASGLITNGISEDEIALQMYERPEFKKRFPAIDARRKAGLAPISPSEYLAYENTVRQAAKGFGVNITQDEINRALVADVSAQEQQERLGMAARAVYQSDRHTRSELERLYGITSQDLVRYWLNPKEQLPALERRFVTAHISGEAQRAGFDTQLQQSQLEYLYGRGMTGEGAAESFGALVENQELFEAVDQTEEDIGVDTQLKLITGDKDVEKEVEKRAQKRVAPFQQGGGFATGQTGVSGLGSANR